MEGSTRRLGRIRVAADWNFAGNVRRRMTECHRVARAAHSNFYPAFFLLPKAKRDGIVALYAFMALDDDGFR